MAVSSNTRQFYFLSITVQFYPSFPSGLGPDLNHQYSCCDSVPLRQWPSSHAFSKYWTSYSPHQRLGESDHWSDLLYSVFPIFYRGSWERQNFFCVSCFQSMEIFVDILTKGIFFPQKTIFPLLRNLIYQTKGSSAEKLTLKGVRGHQCAQAVQFRCLLLPGNSRGLQDIDWVLISASFSHSTPHQLSLGDTVPSRHLSSERKMEMEVR